MGSTENLKIAQHNSLQELANHYDSINWNMHTIFVAVHAGIIGWLMISISSLWNHRFHVALITLIVASFAGYYLVKAWRLMFNRHRLYIKTAYQKLSKIEKSLENCDGCLSSFKVHTLMGLAIEKSRGNHGEGSIAASTVIFKIQKYIKYIYIFISGVALIRVLFFICSSIGH